MSMQANDTLGEKASDLAEKTARPHVVLAGALAAGLALAGASVAGASSTAAPAQGTPAQGVPAASVPVAIVPMTSIPMATAPAGATDAAGVSAAVPQVAAANGQRVAPAAVEGAFGWSQDTCATNAELARNLYGASDVLCGSGDARLQLTSAAASEAPAIASIAVTGDVANEFVADVAQMNEAAPAAQTLGCSCAGNPVDGRASGNAAVEGFKLSALIARAQPSAQANTLTFVCADGYEVALPLFYAQQHYALVVSRVNGEACSDALGCANQLWLGGSSARTFARDIVEVRITAEDEAPAAPGAPRDANLPNVSVLAGGEVA